jgi:predicted HicB family RNase H-like nuclease
VIRGYSFRADWSEEDGAYVATSPEVPGLSGVDENAGAALAELREAIEMALAVLEEDGETPPAPRALSEHSGQFRMRLPRGLHSTLARQAEEEGVSLNTYVTTLLAFAAGTSSAQTEAGAELHRLLLDIRFEVAGRVAPSQRRNSSATAYAVTDAAVGGSSTAAPALFGTASSSIPVTRE